jgi:hypothetical protein
MDDITKLERQIAELQADLEKAKAHKKALEELSEEQQLAILLHDLLCRWNHMDGCSWHYYSDTDPSSWRSGTSRYTYLIMARKVLNVMVEPICGIRQEHRMAFMKELLKAMK